MSIRAQARPQTARALLLVGGLVALAAWGPPEATLAAPGADEREAEPDTSPTPPELDEDAEDPPSPSAPSDPSAPSSDPPADPFAEGPPRDPDDSAFLPPPANQLGQWSAGRTPALTRGFDDDHWVQLTAAPTYAAIHAPLIGRGGGPTRGGGVALELDLRMFRWLFFRVYGSHTLHPGFEETSFVEDDDELTLTANEGLIQATNTGASIVYALDIGRYVPRVDVGAGLLFLRTPPAAQDGQWGGECRQNGVCDLGLGCNGDNVCRPTPVPEVHIGIGLDVLIGRRFALGVAVRYYALFSALGDLPFYLQGAARLSVRF